MARFDSILVRLKVIPLDRGMELLRSFDSILVRLKEYGLKPGGVPEDQVSIPYWFD